MYIRKDVHKGGTYTWKNLYKEGRKEGRMYTERDVNMEGRK